MLMPPKAILLFCLLLCGAAGNAQLTRGTRMVGATIGSGYFSAGKTEITNQGYTSYNHNWNASLTPSIGWFIHDNAAAGANLFFNSSHQKTWSASSGITSKEDRNNNTDYGLGVFYRQYFASASSLRPFAHVYANGGSGITKTGGFYYASTYTQTYEGKTSGRFFCNLGLNGGVTKFLNPSVGIEAFIGYSYSYTKFTTTTTSVSVETGNNNVTTSKYTPVQTYSGNNLNIGIGLQFFLPAHRP